MEWAKDNLMSFYLGKIWEMLMKGFTLEEVNIEEQK